MLDVVNHQKSFVQKPAVVKQYNLHIGCVDQVGQQLNSFHILCKTCK